MEAVKASLLRQLPAVDEVLRHERLSTLISQCSRSWAANIIRNHLAVQRQQILHSPPGDLALGFNEEAFLQEVAALLQKAGHPSLRRVINATGVIIHTNLGRSPLAMAAQKQIQETSSYYNTLEYDLEQGQRGSRQVHLEGLLRELTGVEAALVVNNNASAVMLALQTLAQDQEVVISRGQLVEIGGSFRMPDIMAASGAILKEVGTTNKTYLSDYEKAISSQTAMLLKVHPSNFRIVGFTREVPLTELVALGRRYGLLVMEDLGSGCFIDLSRYGLEKEPTVQETLAAGPDLVLFSGDKLLGGPQAGIVLGRSAVVERLRQNPLMRALRPDKLSLAGLEATLRLYLDESQAVSLIPTLARLTCPLPEVERQARALARSIKKHSQGGYRVAVKPSTARLGGGALPERPIPSYALTLSLPPLAPHQLEIRLRQAGTPVIARLEQQELLLDVRTILPQDSPALLASLLEIMPK